MRYRIEPGVTDPTPTVLVLESGDDGKEKVIWHLTWRHSAPLILLEKVGDDHMVVADWNGRIELYHLPTRNRVAQQKLAADIRIGARVATDGQTIQVAYADDDNYRVDMLEILDAMTLTRLKRFELPDREEFTQLDLTLRQIFAPYPDQLWFYDCEASFGFDSPAEQAFYQLNLTTGEADFQELPGLGNANDDYCLPALNGERNLGVMLDWGRLPIVTNDAGEPEAVLCLTRFSLDDLSEQGRIATRHFDRAALERWHADADLLLDPEAELDDDYREAQGDLFEALTRMHWQDDTLCLHFEDGQHLRILANGEQQGFQEMPSQPYEWTPLALFDRDLEGRIPLFVGDDDQRTLRQMGQACEDIDRQRRGQRFAFALMTSDGSPVEQAAFFQRVASEHHAKLAAMLEAFIALDEMLYDDLNAGYAALCHVAKALAMTSCPEYLPLLTRYVEALDLDHELFVEESLLGTIVQYYGAEDPGVIALESHIRGWHGCDEDDEYDEYEDE
ncbi:hypothetical protein [Ferrimonas balearica]|uniref:hypothetical protein n=1 Tax=Ferrimonas balearica TaxID=44012 RepID=UPI001C9942A8|nr:hypothetical protein [Ferrimonas balearica]MBY5922627.1 hypothetical protein [Ferrimonas balearica]MBY5995611.1 hypothetical protein [Ferrimonas balearica]